MCFIQSDRIVTFIEALIDKANAFTVADEALFDIIAEEAGSFFAGDKSAEEVAALINKRATKILQER